jgi:hypothetical protein
VEDKASDEAEDAIVMVDGNDKGNYLMMTYVFKM